jgi:hypothetical protein
MVRRILQKALWPRRGERRAMFMSTMRSPSCKRSGRRPTAPRHWLALPRGHDLMFVDEPGPVVQAIEDIAR